MHSNHSVPIAADASVQQVAEVAAVSRNSSSVTAAAEDGVPTPSSGTHAAIAPAGDDMQLLQPRDCSWQHFDQDYAN